MYTSLKWGGYNNKLNRLQFRIKQWYISIMCNIKIISIKKQLVKTNYYIVLFIIEFGLLLCSG